MGSSEVGRDFNGGSTMTDLGRMIGKISDSFKVTNDAGGVVSLLITYDFENATDSDIRSWLCGNRRIAMQRPLRKLSVKELEELNGTTVPAGECGKKVKSAEEQIQVFMAAFTSQGIDVELARKLATAAVENPSLLKVSDE